MPEFEPVAAAGLGSMSSVVRNDSEASSVRVDVIVNSASRSAFCSALGVPLRSRICLRRLFGWVDEMVHTKRQTFWKLEKDESPMRTM